MTEQERQLTRERFEMEREVLRRQCRDRKRMSKSERRRSDSMPWYWDELSRLQRKHDRLQKAVDALVSSGLMSDKAKALFISELNKPV